MESLSTDSRSANKNRRRYIFGTLLLAVLLFVFVRVSFFGSDSSQAVAEDEPYVSGDVIGTVFYPIKDYSYSYYQHDADAAANAFGLWLEKWQSDHPDLQVVSTVGWPHCGGPCGEVKLAGIQIIYRSKKN